MNWSFPRSLRPEGATIGKRKRKPRIKSEYMKRRERERQSAFLQRRAAEKGVPFLEYKPGFRVVYQEGKAVYAAHYSISFESSG